MKYLLKSLILGAATAAILGPLAYAGSTGRALAKEECSACHMAYQGGFLPIRSWRAIMRDLPNHFGEDASLDEATRKAIEDYFVSKAADRNGRKPRWMNSLAADEIPLRITKLAWFRHEHGRRARNWIKQHPDAGSISKRVCRCRNRPVLPAKYRHPGGVH